MHVDWAITLDPLGTPIGQVLGMRAQQDSEPYQFLRHVNDAVVRGRRL